MNQEELSKLREEMKSQDNAATAHPLFVVFDWERVPTEEGYSDKYEYVSTDEWDVIAENKEELIEWVKEREYESPTRSYFNAMPESGVLEWINHHIAFFEDKETQIEKVHYLKKEVFITAFFTRKAAQAFIDANHYHYKDPHIYVATMWRNYEMQRIRKGIMEGEFEIKEGKRNDKRDC